jgi:hypothetical protein
VSNVVDDGIKADVRRGDLLRSQLEPDMQLLVKIRVVAELHERLAANWLARIEPRDPWPRRDREGSRGALFNVGELEFIDAFAHDCIFACG